MCEPCRPARVPPLRELANELADVERHDGVVAPEVFRSPGHDGRSRQPEGAGGVVRQAWVVQVLYAHVTGARSRLLEKKLGLKVIGDVHQHVAFIRYTTASSLRRHEAELSLPFQREAGANVRGEGFLVRVGGELAWVADEHPALGPERRHQELLKRRLARFVHDEHVERRLGAPRVARGLDVGMLEDADGRPGDEICGFEDEPLHHALAVGLGVEAALKEPLAGRGLRLPSVEVA